MFDITNDKTEWLFLDVSDTARCQTITQPYSFVEQFIDYLPWMAIYQHYLTIFNKHIELPH